MTRSHAADSPSDPGDVPDAGGPAARVARPRRAAPADAVRPTRAEISLDHLRHNLFVLRRHLEPRRTVTGDGVAHGASDPTSSPAPSPAIWAVLKADAYGHGAPAVGRTLERAGVDGFCVALLEEALELRSAGIRAPILVMGGYYGPRRDGLEEVFEHDLIPVVYDRGHLDKLAQIARDRARPIGVHLKVDTGMHRLGVFGDELVVLAAALRAHAPLVRLDGLMTHLACADDDLEVTTNQLAMFGAAERQLRGAGLVARVRHAANSAGCVRTPESRLDLVRPGIAVFGYKPWVGQREDASEAALATLRPVMKVRSEIVALRTIASGERVGYGQRYVAHGTRRIATVAMGYGDGISRALSCRGEVLVRGRRAPIAGVVSMDLTSVDVTDIDGTEVGDEVVFLGAQDGPLGSDVIRAEEIAEHTQTIPWEVLTQVSRRVPRFYRER